MRPEAPKSVEGAPPKVGARPHGILVVDDEPAILESIDLTLGTEYRVFTAASGEAGLEILAAEEIALVIADQVMPGMSGVEFFEQVVQRSPGTLRIMLTGYADLSSLIHGINEGHIYRYIAKPWEPDELRFDVKRALETWELQQRNDRLAEELRCANTRLESENRFLRDEARGRFSFAGIIGDSPAMQQVFDLTEKVAKTDATVLITGETGTGKDVIARAIHYEGGRAERPFVAQNCGSLPETLLESELFGHRKGSFTGADRDKEGLFDACDGGTIFLDEIGETGTPMQVRLLRVLQDGEIRALGSSVAHHVDVRVIAATNCDLRKTVDDGGFREDLYYRLAWSRSSCRRCVIVARTFRRSRNTFSGALPRASGRASGALRMERWTGWWPSNGRGTFANSKTRSNGWWRSAGEKNWWPPACFRSVCAAPSPATSPAA